MPNNFYLGNVSDLASNMGSMFGNRTGLLPGENPVRAPGVGGLGGNTGVLPRPTPPNPIREWKAPLPPQQQSGGTYDPLAAQAIRPTSFGNFDPSYGQNLATFIGNTFQRPQSNQPLQFNPYGNLTDANIQYPNLGGGNAPLVGLPETLLQWAQWFNQTALKPGNDANG